MSTIRTVYADEPKFPATDQHPSAVRYQVSGKFVDAVGGAPTSDEVSSFLSPVSANKTLIDKAKADTITHEELVTLLKAKGVI